MPGRVLKDRLISLVDEFAGIRYRSRLGDEFVNWAIFEPPPEAEAPLAKMDSSEIEPGDPDLVAALRLLDLELV